MASVSKQSRSLQNWLRQQGADEKITCVINALALAAANIADAIYMAPLEGKLGQAGQFNVQGEQQKQLDIISNDIMMSELKQCRHISAMVSEEVEYILRNQCASKSARLAVCFDPLDGSSNIETNGTIGSIFSVLQLDKNQRAIATEDILSAVKNQVAAGYFLYGPSTLLVVTTGQSVAMFGLDQAGKFELVEPNITIPEASAEFSINMAYRQFWHAQTARYIEDCLAGKNGPRGKDFNMRWMGAMVADLHRIFMRGGIFIYPALTLQGSEQGKLRLLYEVNPMAMLIEVAGGKALSGELPANEIIPHSLHQRAPFVAGSIQEVLRYQEVAQYIAPDSISGGSIYDSD